MHEIERVGRRADGTDRTSHHQRCRRVGCDDDHGREARQDRGHACIGLIASDHREAAEQDDIAAGRRDGAGPRRRCETRLQRNGERPERELEHPEWRQEEHGVGIIRQVQDRQDEGRQSDGRDGAKHRPAMADPHQEQRRQRIELHFQRQRPQMQQRQLVRIRREIGARLAPILHVGDRQQPVRRLLRQLAQGFGRQEQPADRKARGNRRDQRRQDAPRAPQIELRQREPSGPEIAQDLAGDEIAGDDEEDVDAGEARLEARNSQVEENDDDDGDGPEAIDVSTMIALQCGPPRASFEADEMRRHEWQQRETVVTRSDQCGVGQQAGLRQSRRV